jgi:uncharacterized protein
MSDEVLAAAFSRVFKSPYARDLITVVWHAGEPLTLPSAWYEHAFGMAERNRPRNLIVQHHFQSNGLLLNENWLDLFRRKDVTIGLSIDGPEDLHDARRRTRSDGPTHAKAMRAAHLLREAGIPFHVITVLSPATLDAADRLFDFYVAHDICKVAFNIDEQDGFAGPSSMSGPDNVSRFRMFLRRFLARMMAEPDRLSLREFSNMLDVIKSQGLNGRRAQDAEPMRIISIDVSGRVSSFSPELLGVRDPRYNDFVFGDIRLDSLETIEQRIIRSALLADIEAGIEACAQSCAYFDFCGGGSPCNKLGEWNNLRSTQTLFCRLMRRELLEAVLEILESAMATPRDGVPDSADSRASFAAVPSSAD